MWHRSQQREREREREKSLVLMYVEHRSQTKSRGVRVDVCIDTSVSKSGLLAVCRSPLEFGH